MVVIQELIMQRPNILGFLKKKEVHLLGIMSESMDHLCVKLYRYTRKRQERQLAEASLALELEKQHTRWLTDMPEELGFLNRILLVMVRQPATIPGGLKRLLKKVVQENRFSEIL
jgi:hypothetical protein